MVIIIYLCMNAKPKPACLCDARRQAETNECSPRGGGLFVEMEFKH